MRSNESFLAANAHAQQTHEAHPHCVYVLFKFSKIFFMRTSSQNSKIYGGEKAKKKLNVANVIDCMSWCAINIHTSVSPSEWYDEAYSGSLPLRLRMRLIPSIFSVHVRSHRHLFRRSAHVHSDSDVSNVIHPESEFQITRSLLEAA